MKFYENTDGSDVYENQENLQEQGTALAVINTAYWVSHELSSLAMDAPPASVVVDGDGDSLEARCLHLVLAMLYW